MSQLKDDALTSHLQTLQVDNILVKGHPAGLFVLFFTEMWERFSYYGMRALLTIFLISEITNGGWGWTNAEAVKLYGLYTGFVFLTPLIGGMIADRLTGYKKAILIGALIMTCGHAAMALEGIHANFFFLGLILMILGNGLFKPNIASMVGKLYPDSSSKKDAGYTIFYMGINGGAFLGMMLCGYIGEKVGWHYGFGLAGLFMFLGMLQFYFAQRIFGTIGESPKAVETDKIKDQNQEEVNTSSHVNRDRLIVIGIFMFASVIFHLAFEQAGGSMTIFAKNYTQRVLDGHTAIIFKWIDAALTVFPILVVTTVLFALAKKIWSKYPMIVICSGISFVIIWILCGWKLQREFNSLSSEVTVSWFPMLNSFFIITLATSFSRIWEKVWNPSGPIKLALGLAIVGLSFAVLSYGSLAIPQGAKTASVSMIWLILAYFLQTVGELCLSPVGLSYVSKLSPKKVIGLLFGIWYCGNAIANFIGGLIGSYIDDITASYSMSYFFGMFTVVSFIFAIILALSSSGIKKMMHGIH
ncbi:peptide MFS transporter [Sphingobacterium sp. SRCM116780]|uniref:peptide MFS transporter n=1 Tax=Sphingobacterium sp. SRCM116780 TaxID=2907623 RepID=UPI001F39AA7B|nr:peptide MFS transporter [Sphingobacterium sp. SRCM116780]UIR56744.1 peptide MFS transporter [Sphingobacterium sp. SRCM116780]